jgi:hypothetical protein
MQESTTRRSFEGMDMRAARLLALPLALLLAFPALAAEPAVEPEGEGTELPLLVTDYAGLELFLVGALLTGGWERTMLFPQAMIRIWTLNFTLEEE